MNIKEFYILGLPIETDIGLCHFLKVKEYPDYFYDLQVISLTKDHLIHKYTELNKNGMLTDFITELSKYDLFELAFNIPELRESYIKMFSKLFEDEDAIVKINQDNFYFYRQLIMTMNCLKEEKINPNPEIQRAIERSKRVKAADSEPLEFADIVSSIVGWNGLTYKDLNDFTVYQLYMTYHRIAQIKNYDTSTLFATVSDKVKIDSWSKHIDLFAEEKHAIAKEEMDKKTKDLFGNQ